MIDWSKSTREDIVMIGKIVSRALIDLKLYDDKQCLYMDLCACRIVEKINLSTLLATDDSDFAHDIVGIRDHIDRHTGTLQNCFLPRCGFED